MKKILLATLALSSLGALAQRHEPKVIYGDDNRQDIYEVTSSALVEVANSTAAMIPAKDLATTGGGWSGGSKKDIVISGPTLMSRGICATERFAAQPTAANCSGFLVSDKILVTAGHCMKSMGDCSDFKWVFDYKLDTPGVNKVTVRKENIYGCKKIIEQVLSNDQNDYAVIELDRPVTARRPLNFRKSGKIAVGTPIVVIGHPTGLPTKVAAGAKVRSTKEMYFVGNLDTYGGNSGSAVFNANTLEVEGILVRGDTDYVAGPNGCRVSNVQGNDDGRGEDVTYITNIKSLKRLQ
ncbi:MAG: trypsin-like peptidase domain-containing protein [Bacteriovoracaceae bacterium]|nr:trypsin-like peptidase domain-containing protein [Bacteriovoracaceae bacterium]